MKAFIFVFLISSSVFASNFEYSAFTGIWLLDSGISPINCVLNYRGPMQLIGDAENHNVRGYFKDGYRIEIANINEGAIKFNSCWSDGIMGYSEVVGEGTRLTDTIVYQDGGFFCLGGSEVRRSVDQFELKDNLFVMNLVSRMGTTNFLLGQSEVCTFKRIQ